MDLCLSRRRFLRYSLGALAGLGLVPGCATLPVYRIAEVTTEGFTMPLDDFDALAGDNGILSVVSPEFESSILLIRREDGTFLALTSRCTHQGCTVKPSRSFLVCPCHGSTFDLNGKVLRGPARTPLPRFSATIQSDLIEVRLTEFLK